MKEFEEYLREEIKKYEDLMSEYSSYDEGGAYHYYEGRADALDAVLEKYLELRGDVKMTGEKEYMTDLVKKLNEIADDILRYVEGIEVDACDPKKFYVKFHMGQQYKDVCATEFVEEISRIRGVNLLNSSIKYTPGNPREIVIEAKAFNQERMQHLMSRINNWDCIHGSARMWSVLKRSINEGHNLNDAGD